jgi:hypothetical protein
MTLRHAGKMRRKREITPGRAPGRAQSHPVSEPLCQEPWGYLATVPFSLAIAWHMNDSEKRDD